MIQNGLGRKMRALVELDNFGRPHWLFQPSGFIHLFPQFSLGAVPALVKGTVYSRVLFWVRSISSDPGPGNKGSLYPCQFF